MNLSSFFNSIDYGKDLGIVNIQHYSRISSGAGTIVNITPASDQYALLYITTNSTTGASVACGLYNSSGALLMNSDIQATHYFAGASDFVATEKQNPIMSHRGGQIHVYANSNANGPTHVTLVLLEELNGSVVPEYYQ